MEAWAQEYIKVWQERTDAIGEQLLQSFQRDSQTVGKYQLEDVVQIVRGVGAMMFEELSTQGSDMRDAYMQSVIPGLLAQGEKLAWIAAQDMAIVLHIYGDIMPRLSPEHHDAARDFFIKWEAQFIFDIVRVGLEHGATT